MLIRNYKKHCNQIGLAREVEFIFDKQMGAKARVADAWKFFESEAPRMLDFMGGMPSFKNDEELAPLQAADLMAWWIRRQIADDLAGVPRLEFPWEGKDQIPCLRARYDGELLREAYGEMMEGRPSKKLLFHLGLWP